MLYKNVTWNDCVGNLEISGGKIIFCADEKSVNGRNQKIEIPINEINKQKLKKDLFAMKNLFAVHIENSKANFEVYFGYTNGYKRFADDIFSKV